MLQGTICWCLECTRLTELNSLLFQSLQLVQDSWIDLWSCFQTPWSEQKGRMNPNDQREEQKTSAGGQTGHTWRSKFIIADHVPGRDRDPLQPWIEHILQNRFVHGLRLALCGGGLGGRRCGRVFVIECRIRHRRRGEVVMWVCEGPRSSSSEIPSFHSFTEAPREVLPSSLDF